MGAVLTIIAAVIILMVCSILLKWRLKIGKLTTNPYWVFPLVGAILCLLLGFVNLDDVGNIFVDSSTMNPLKILVIFLSFVGLSVFLDEVGLFKYVAQAVAEKCKRSQKELFFGFSIAVALLTVFTSNDILILTFTPFLCHFAKHAKINVLPYVVAEFVMANVWSMFFVIGNPTNIYLSSIFEISFAEYALKMFLPTIAAGLVAIFLMYLLFRKKLEQPILVMDEKRPKLDKPLLLIGVIGLMMAIMLTAVGSYFNFPVWQMPLICLMLTYFLAFVVIVFREKSLSIFGRAFKKLPYAIVPFLLSMAVLVLALERTGFIELVVKALNGGNVFSVGGLAFLSGNLLNNIPMTIFFGDVLSNMVNPGVLVYTVIAASNICAFLTPVGALAGIMFMRILKNNKVEFPFKKFIFYGVIISVPTLIVTLTVLNVLGF